MVTLVSGNSYASDEEKYTHTINVFKQSPQVQPYFKNAYGYAGFPIQKYLDDGVSSFYY